MDEGALNFLVLFGLTGCGKSDILGCIRDLGCQVLLLEELACHKGSAFGGLQGLNQPSQSEFETKLWEEINSFDPSRPVWVEYETGYLGKLQIPGPLLETLRKSEMLIIQRDRLIRIRRIIDEYATLGQEALLSAAQKLKKKMSAQKYRLLRRSIKNEDFETAVSILLTYYDKVYENGMREGQFRILAEIELPDTEPENIARLLIERLADLHKSGNPM